MQRLPAGCAGSEVGDGGQARRTARRAGRPMLVQGRGATPRKAVPAGASEWLVLGYGRCRWESGDCPRWPLHGAEMSESGDGEFDQRAEVVWCARDLGCDFERIDAGGAFGVVDTPAFDRLNPNHKVPVIQDGDLVLWESNAIVRYLCAKHAQAGLSPAAPAEHADCDRWMDWQATELTPSLRRVSADGAQSPRDASRRCCVIVRQTDLSSRSSTLPGGSAVHHRRPFTCGHSAGCAILAGTSCRSS